MARTHPNIVVEHNGVPQPGATVLIVRRTTGTAAALFANEEGTVQRAGGNPVTCDAQGRIPDDVWVDRGRYTAICSAPAMDPYQLHFEASPAGDQSIDRAWLPTSMQPSRGATPQDEALRALGSGAGTAAAGNDARFLNDTERASIPTPTQKASLGNLPTSGQAAALAGSGSTPPSGTNRFVLLDHPAVSNQRPPTDGSVTNQKVAPGAGIDVAKLSRYGELLLMYVSDAQPQIQANSHAYFLGTGTNVFIPRSGVVHCLAIQWGADIRGGIGHIYGQWAIDGHNQNAGVLDISGGQTKLLISHRAQALAAGAHSFEHRVENANTPVTWHVRGHTLMMIFLST